MTTQEINAELHSIITQTTLPQAVRLSLTYLKRLYPTLDSGELYSKIRFKANPSLAFQKSELSHAVLKYNEDGAYIELTLNFLATFGSSSPLPSHYSETVLQNADGDGVLKDFLDIFNHNLEKNIFPIWEKHRYYARYQHDLNDGFSKYILSFIGLYQQVENHQCRLDLHKLIPYLGLILLKQRSISTVLPILRHYLSHEHIFIEECIEKKVTIPAWQQVSLGEDNCALGKNFLIGDSIRSKNTMFRILLKSMPWNDLNAYSPVGTKMDDLAELLRFLFSEPLAYETVLEIDQEDICQLSLGDKQTSYLGVNTIIGNAENNLQVHFSQQGNR